MSPFSSHEADFFPNFLGRKLRKFESFIMQENVRKIFINHSINDLPENLVDMFWYSGLRL